MKSILSQFLILAMVSPSWALTPTEEGQRYGNDASETVRFEHRNVDAPPHADNGEAKNQASAEGMKCNAALRAEIGQIVKETATRCAALKNMTANGATECQIQLTKRCDAVKIKIAQSYANVCQEYRVGEEFLTPERYGRFRSSAEQAQKKNVLKSVDAEIASGKIYDALKEETKKLLMVKEQNNLTMENSNCQFSAHKESYKQIVGSLNSAIDRANDKYIILSAVHKNQKTQAQEDQQTSAEKSETVGTDSSTVSHLGRYATTANVANKEDDDSIPGPAKVALAAGGLTAAALGAYYLFGSGSNTGTGSLGSSSGFFGHTPSALEPIGNDAEANAILKQAGIRLTGAPYASLSVRSIAAAVMAVPRKCWEHLKGMEFKHDPNMRFQSTQANLDAGFATIVNGKIVGKCLPGLQASSTLVKLRECPGYGGYINPRLPLHEMMHLIGHETGLQGLWGKNGYHNQGCEVSEYAQRNKKHKPSKYPGEDWAESARIGLGETSNSFFPNCKEKYSKAYELVVQKCGDQMPPEYRK